MPRTSPPNALSSQLREAVSGEDQRHDRRAAQLKRLMAALASGDVVIIPAVDCLLSLTLRLTPDLSPCLVDRVQFDAALLNLVINASDAMPGGGSIEIGTASWTEPETSDALKPGPYVRV